MFPALQLPQCYWLRTQPPFQYLFWKFGSLDEKRNQRVFCRSFQFSVKTWTDNKRQLLILGSWSLHNQFQDYSLYVLLLAKNIPFEIARVETYMPGRNSSDVAPYFQQGTDQVAHKVTAKFCESNLPPYTLCVRRVAEEGWHPTQMGLQGIVVWSPFSCSELVRRVG